MICEDPRQAVPATGQTWTSLTELSSSRRNTILQDVEDERVQFILTEPAFAINQTRRFSYLPPNEKTADG